MYRKRNGSLGFSFTRFANAAVPNFFADPSSSYLAGIHPYRRDMLYSHQLASRNPYGLDDRSFFVAGIVENESLSKKVFKILTKIELLTAAGEVDTKKLEGKKFMHQMAVLNINRQRDLIDMLFWWEEECIRLRKLKSEDTELTGTIHGIEAEVGNGDDDEDVPHYEDDGTRRRGLGSGNDEDRRQMVDQLRFAREKVRMRIRQRPSERRQDVEAGVDDLQTESFVRLDRSISTPVAAHAASAMQTVGGEEMPPAYYR